MDQIKETNQPEEIQDLDVAENVPQPKISEKASRFLSFITKPSSRENPDTALAEIANGSATENKDNKELVERSKKIVAGLKKVGEILKVVKDNDLAQGVVAAGLGLLASYIGVSSEVINLAQVATINVVGEGSLVDKGKNIARGAASVIGGEAFGDMADIAQTAIEKGLRSELTGKAVNYARDKMMRRSSSYL